MNKINFFKYFQLTLLDLFLLLLLDAVVECLVLLDLLLKRVLEATVLLFLAVFGSLPSGWLLLASHAFVTVCTSVVCSLCILLRKFIVA